MALPDGDPGSAIRALPLAVQLANQAWDTPFAEQAGVAADSAWFGMSVSPDDAGLVVIAPAYLQRFGEKQRPGVVPGWDAAGLIIEAVRKAGSSSPPKVRDAIEQMTAFRALQGPFDMDRMRHKPALLPVAIMRIVRGAYVTAEPVDPTR